MQICSKETDDTYAVDYTEYEAKDWLSVIRKCQIRGIDDKEWCKRNNMPYAVLVRNVLELKNDGRDVLEKLHSSGYYDNWMKIINECCSSGMAGFD